MTSLPYVLMVLFTLNDGRLVSMETNQAFASPLSCSMQAFLANEAARDRTYVCVTQERAAILTGGPFGLAAANLTPR